jgi:hypothetical protein
MCDTSRRAPRSVSGMTCEKTRGIHFGPARIRIHRQALNRAGYGARRDWTEMRLRQSLVPPQMSPLLTSQRQLFEVPRLRSCAIATRSLQEFLAEGVGFKWFSSPSTLPPGGHSALRCAREESPRALPHGRGSMEMNVLPHSAAQRRALCFRRARPDRSKQLASLCASPVRHDRDIME